MQKIILASKSENRKKAFQVLGAPFEVVVSNFNEEKIKEKEPEIRARKIAYAKAKKVARNHEGIIIACDTFTVCQGKILEKPGDLRQAKKMLKFLSGKKAVSYTGFCWLDTKKNNVVLKAVPTKVVFRKIYKEEIEKYVKKFPVITWAAAYAASELYVMGMIKSTSGSLTGFTHGLPTELLIPLLRKEGYNLDPGLYLS